MQDHRRLSGESEFCMSESLGSSSFGWTRRNLLLIFSFFFVEKNWNKEFGFLGSGSDEERLKAVEVALSSSSRRMKFRKLMMAFAPVVVVEVVASKDWKSLGSNPTT